MGEAQVSIFEKFYGKSAEDFSEENKNLTKKDMKRKFEASYDKFLDAKINCEKEIQGFCENNFKRFHFDGYRMKLQEIKDLENAMKEVAELHLEFFGEEIRK